MAAVASPHEAERPNAEAAREVSAKMTKARCKAMVRELLSAYAAKSFQTKLTEILNKEVENKTVITDELAARWAWAENVHNDILAQYGFATGHGMEYLTLPLELILKSCPECMANVQKISEFLKLKTWPLQKSTETEKEEAKAAPQGLVAGRELSKPRALALQTELLAILSTPSFQKKLAEMSRKKLPHDTLHEYNRDAICKLFDDAQMETIARYGFDTSKKGVEDMFAALEKLHEDPDVFVNAFAIEEALLMHENNGFWTLSCKKVCNGSVLGVKPRTKFTVAKLLRKQLAGFSTPGFQHAVVKLKRKAELEQACDGYYHLNGRAELALTVQRRILPGFGFPASRAGVLEMVLHCTNFLEDDEIAKLWDDINSKLGMTQEACRRFRESATGFKGFRTEAVDADVMVGSMVPVLDLDYVDLGMRIK
eukprot:symbB.v1.2.028097.t1/scaffold2943.1/size66754/3